MRKELFVPSFYVLFWYLPGETGEDNENVNDHYHFVQTGSVSSNTYFSCNIKIPFGMFVRFVVSHRAAVVCTGRNRAADTPMRSSSGFAGWTRGGEHKDAEALHKAWACIRTSRPQSLCNSTITCHCYSVREASRSNPEVTAQVLHTFFICSLPRSPNHPQCD